MRHRNNFDFLRLLFASLVIVTHSVALTTGGDADFLSRLTDGQTSCSYLGVRGFFTISGYLIFQSLQRSSSAGSYLRKRLLRIFPGLLVMLAVLTFAAGPALSRLSPAAYFSDRVTWHYPLSVLHIPRIPRTDGLPGVFIHNPVRAVNGSLWTIWFELLFYGALMICFPVRRSPALLRVALPVAWLGLFTVLLNGHTGWGYSVFPFTGTSTEVALDLFLYFTGGSCLALLPWQESGRLRVAAQLIGCLLLLGSAPLHLFVYLRYIGWPLLVTGVGTSCVSALAAIRRAGEPSYGLYIYAYPVQQAVIQYLHPAAGITTLITLPAALLLGYASWHLVEKRFLQQKKLRGDMMRMSS